MVEKATKGSESTDCSLVAASRSSASRKHMLMSGFAHSKRYSATRAQLAGVKKACQGKLFLKGL